MKYFPDVPSVFSVFSVALSHSALFEERAKKAAAAGLPAQRGCGGRGLGAGSSASRGTGHCGGAWTPRQEGLEMVGGLKVWRRFGSGK